MSWDLQEYGTHPEVMEAQQALLKSLRPDALCAQGLWDDSPDHRELSNLVKGLAKALDMEGRPVAAPRSSTHMAVLWRPGRASLEDWRARPWTAQGVGDATLSVEGRVLRVAVSQLAWANPVQRLSDAYDLQGYADPWMPTVLGLGQHCVGEEDPEPDQWLVPPERLWGRSLWTDDPRPRSWRADRRPAMLLERQGLFDVAQHLGKPWQATSESTPAGKRAVRHAVMRVSVQVVPALRDFRVIGAQGLSDDDAVMVDLDMSKLDDDRAAYEDVCEDDGQARVAGDPR